MTNAHAQVWTADTIVSGTNLTGMPVGVGLRQWGPADEIYVVYDFMTSTSDHELWLEGWTCGGVDCATLTQDWGPDKLGATLLTNEQLAPAVSMHLDPAGERIVHAFRRIKFNTDCDADGIPYQLEAGADQDAMRMGLGERMWATWGNGGLGGDVASRIITSNPAGTCDDNNVPFAKWRADLSFACWTHKTFPFGVEKNQVWCDERDTAAAGFWNTGARLELDNGAGTETHDHVWFDFDGNTTERVAIHREKAAGDRILVRFMDRAGSPVAELDQLGDGEDYPSIDIIHGKHYLATYQDADGATPDDLRFASCNDSLTDCTDPVNWTDVLLDEDDGISHPEFKADGNKQFIVYQKPVLVGGNLKTRAHVMWRCGNNAWNGPSMIDVGTPINRNHSLDNGRPHVGIDVADDLLFVGLLEVTNADSSLVVARAPYTPCSISTTEF